jgi:hypothetical protein
VDGTAETNGLEPRRLGRVWAGTLLSPAAWFLDLELGVALSRTAAGSDHKRWLVIAAISTLALATVALLSSWREWRLHTRLVEEGRTELTGARVVAGWGVALGLFFMLLIAAMAVPLFVLDPRDLP